MTRRHSNAGGVFIAGGTVFGAVAGAALGQPVIGLLAGLGAGTAAALLTWTIDRRRR